RARVERQPDSFEDLALRRHELPEVLHHERVLGGHGRRLYPTLHAMAYRGEDTGDALEAPTADGPLRVEVGPRRVSLSAGNRTVHIADRFVTIVETKKKKQPESIRIEGRLVVARDVPHEDLGLWLELVDKKPGMQRIFGVEPMSLLEPGGLTALQRLDA